MLFQPRGTDDDEYALLVLRVDQLCWSLDARGESCSSTSEPP